MDSRRKLSGEKVNQAKSKKALFADLEKITGNAGWGLKSPKIKSENFGKKSCIFIFCGRDAKKALEKKLHQQGHRVDFDYWPGGGAVEVEVTYFKGADIVD